MRYKFIKLVAQFLLILFLHGLNTAPILAKGLLVDVYPAIDSTQFQDGSSRGGLSLKLHPTYFFSAGDFKWGISNHTFLKSQGTYDALFSAAMRYGSTLFFQFDPGLMVGSFGTGLGLFMMCGWNVSKEISVAYGFVDSLSNQYFYHSPYIGANFAL